MENPLYSKSKSLAIGIVKLNDFLVSGGEFTMSKQILKSGTSVGANIREAKRPQSDADCVSMLYTLTEEVIKILVTIIRNKRESIQNSRKQTKQ